MPIYEYECKKCKHVKEIVMRIVDEPPRTMVCPKCKGEMKKIISQTSFILKGRGWADDGYSS